MDCSCWWLLCVYKLGGLDIQSSGDFEDGREAGLYLVRLDLREDLLGDPLEGKPRLGPELLDPLASDAFSDFHTASVDALASARRRVIRVSTKTLLTKADVQQMFEDQDGLCAYCETELGNDFHGDHMVPVSRGGTTDVINIALACPPCNMRKNKTAEEFFTAPARTSRRCNSFLETV